MNHVKPQGVSLEEWSHRLYSMVDSAQEAIVLIDSAGRVRFWSRAAERIFGCPREEAVGREIHRWLVPERYRQDALGNFARFAVSGSGPVVGKSVELTALRADGEEFPVELSVSAVQFSDEWHAIGVVRDITRRKALENARLSTLENVMSMIDGAPMGIIVVGSDRVVREVNATALEMMGRRKEEVVGHSCAQMVCPAECGRCPIFDMGTRVDHSERTLLRSDGRELPILKTVVPFIYGGEEVVLESFVDISEQKSTQARLEEALQNLGETQDKLLQTEKMAAIGQLAAGVAHEINNPIGYITSNLGSLKGYLEDLVEVIERYGALEEGLEAGARAELRALKERVDLDYVLDDLGHLVEESIEGAERVRQIVQDLKYFAHVDEAEWKWADLREGLRTTLNVVHNELKYKAKVMRELAEIPEVYCLPAQLNQVFMNLLVNAAQAIREQGVITLRSGVDGESVWIEVADTGEGMDERTLKEIFNPFFTTKPVGKGTGLGLSLSYSIVEKHDGRIEVDSVVGEGTRFRVYLPIAGPQRMVEDGNSGAAERMTAPCDDSW